MAKDYTGFIIAAIMTFVLVSTGAAVAIINAFGDAFGWIYGGILGVLIIIMIILAGFNR